MRHVLWLTGLSGSGKSTLAYALKPKIDKCIVLDGDTFRGSVSSDLGFTQKDRQENIRRAAEVASLLTLQGYFVICAFINPTKKSRAAAKHVLYDKYVECYVACTFKECKRRDPKGLYKKFDDGKIEMFTGVDSEYEEPEMADITVFTENNSVDECVTQIFNYLQISKML